MNITDPVADMLTRIRNAMMVRHNQVTVPASRMKEAIAQVLKDEGYISRYEVTREEKIPVLRMYLKYTDRRESIMRGLKRISRPGCRVYTKSGEIPWVQSGLGTVILSTPQGIMSGKEARRLHLGGEILCEVW